MEEKEANALEMAEKKVKEGKEKKKAPQSQGSLVILLKLISSSVSL